MRLSTATLCAATVLLAALPHKKVSAQVLTANVQANSAAPVQAASADGFVDSIGVATHWSYGSYASQSTALQSLLISSGIRHIRDGANPAIMAALLPHGIKETVVLDPINGIVPNLSYWSGAPAASTYGIADYLTNHMPAGSVDALEMPNELDIFYTSYKWHVGDTATLSADPTSPLYYGSYGAAVTQDSWKAIKSNPALASIKIIGPTVGVAYPSPYPAGSLHDYVDWGGFHPYPGRANTWTYPQPYGTISKYYWNSSQPSVNIGTDSYGGTPLMFDWYAPAFANNSDAKPMAATETGYQTGAHAANGISTLAQAKYVPRLFAEYFRNGIARTFYYELYDEGTDQTNGEQNFGLIYNNVTPKPAFTALSSLIALLQEPGASFTPGTLNYQISAQSNGSYNRTGYVHDLLLQKSNGDYYLLVWHEVSDTANTDVNGNSLPAMQRDIAPPALTTSISVPSNIATATLYSYSSSWTLQSQSLPIVSGKLTVPATDTISVIRLSANQAQSAGPISDGTYTLTNASSNRVLDDPESSLWPGTQLIQWDRNGGLNQEWIFKSLATGSYSIQNAVSGLYLTGAGGNGTPLVQEAYSGSKAQSWGLQASQTGFLLINQATGEAVDDPQSNPNDDIGMILYTPHGTANQTWLIH